MGTCVPQFGHWAKNGGSWSQGWHSWRKKVGWAMTSAKNGDLTHDTRESGMGLERGYSLIFSTPKIQSEKECNPPKKSKRWKSRSSPPGRWEGERHVGLGDRQGSEKEEDRGRGRGLRRPPRHPPRPRHLCPASRPPCLPPLQSCHHLLSAITTFTFCPTLKVWN